MTHATSWILSSSLIASLLIWSLRLTPLIVLNVFIHAALIMLRPICFCSGCCCIWEYWSHYRFVNSYFTLGGCVVVSPDQVSQIARDSWCPVDLAAYLLQLVIFTPKYVHWLICWMGLLSTAQLYLIGSLDMTIKSVFSTDICILYFLRFFGSYSNRCRWSSFSAVKVASSHLIFMDFRPILNLLLMSFPLFISLSIIKNF